MSDLRREDGGAARLAEMRREFDESFARPAAGPRRDLERLVSLRAGGDRFAVLLSELSCLERTPRLEPLPDAPPDLLGLAGIRGRLVPVFSLARLLGCQGARGGDAARWLVIVRGEPPIGLAFDALDGYLLVARVDLHPSGDARAHVPSLARAVDGVLGLIDTASITAEISRRTAIPAPRKES